MAPVLQEADQRGWKINIVYTGQHKNSMDDLKRDFDLKTEWSTIYSGKEVNTIPAAVFWLFNIFTRILFTPRSLLAPVDKEHDIILVHGDTFSTILGALLGRRLGIKVAHIESGLTSGNLFHPFPEELTRKLTFRLSDIAFCPGEWACLNLSHLRKLEIINTGENTLIDALRYALNKNHSTSNLPQHYGVVSIHRFENIFNKNRFMEIIQQLITVSEQTPLIFVLHPATRKRLIKAGLFDTLANNPRFSLKDRTYYTDFISILAKSEFVITDGGSNQEELFFMGIPTYLMRKTTERTEGINQNVVLGGYKKESLNEFLNNLERYRIKPYFTNLQPSKTIADRISQYS